MRLRRKNFLTLIELMIAMALALGVLSFALYFYRFAVFSDEMIKKEEEKTFRERVLSGRLTYLFSRLQATNFFTLPEEGGLTLGESLVFNYTSDAYAPTFHGRLLARLFVNPAKQLVLAVWQDNPLADRENPSPPHFEVLSENVEGFSMQFLAGGQKEQEQKDQTQKEGELTPGGYIKEWKKDLQALPAAIKLKLHDKEFAFPIAYCKELK